MLWRIPGAVTEQRGGDMGLKQEAEGEKQLEKTPVQTGSGQGLCARGLHRGGAWSDHGAEVQGWAPGMQREQWKEGWGLLGTLDLLTSALWP